MLGISTFANLSSSNLPCFDSLRTNSMLHYGGIKLKFPILEESQKTSFKNRFQSQSYAKVRRQSSSCEALRSSLSLLLCRVTTMGDMAAHVSSSLYPLHRCKILHLVRHAQGFHNVAQLTDKNASLSYEYFDASLTPLGWEQVDNLCKHVSETGISSKVELVVMSPLLRTMQTAVGVFGGGDYNDDLSSPPLMVAGGGNSSRSSISSTGCPPFMSVELCREHMGVLPCDKRRSISEYRSIFPAIDFSLTESDEDTLWQPNVRETEEELVARGLNFLDWLWTRKEKEIAIVSHGGFLRHTLALFGTDCHPSVKDEICREFSNCELRSMVITDRSAIGKSVPTTEFPGGVPPGPDAPSHHEDIDTLGNEKTLL